MWWVVLSIPAQMQTSNVTASVVGPMTASQFRAQFGDPNNGVNPSSGFATRLQAQAAANRYNANPNPMQRGGVNAPSILGGTGLNPLTGIAAIGDLANRLTQPHLWVRVGEFLAGGVLLIIGLNAMTKGPLRSAATETTKKGIAIGKAVAK